QRLRRQARVIRALAACELTLDDGDLDVRVEPTERSDEVLATRARAEHEHPSVSHQTERAGFEPATHLSARTRFPVALLRPLGHLSTRRQPSGVSARLTARRPTRRTRPRPGSVARSACS